ncbi:hypothetical protein FRB95_000501 [Tulasnella sp. JGI-2019a]|nr:hypothetical protein FRB95_000501 [Tulasnella sp. JGI-2019a]
MGDELAQLHTYEDVKKQCDARVVIIYHAFQCNEVAYPYRAVGQIVGERLSICPGDRSWIHHTIAQAILHSMRLLVPEDTSLSALGGGLLTIASSANM